MTGPEHYTEAERHLSSASYLREPDGLPADPVAAAHHLGLAQAHATLALAAATAHSAPINGDVVGMSSAEASAWHRATRARTEGGADRG